MKAQSMILIPWHGYKCNAKHLPPMLHLVIQDMQQHGSWEQMTCKESICHLSWLKWPKEYKYIWVDTWKSGHNLTKQTLCQLEKLDKANFVSIVPSHAYRGTRKQLNCIGNIQMLMRLCDHSNQANISWEDQKHNRALWMPCQAACYFLELRISRQ